MFSFLALAAAAGKRGPVAVGGGRLPCGVHRSALNFAGGGILDRCTLVLAGNKLKNLK